MKEPLSVHDIAKFGTETLNFVKKVGGGNNHDIVITLILSEAKRQYQIEKELLPYNKLERLIEDFGLNEN